LEALQDLEQYLTGVNIYSPNIPNTEYRDGKHLDGELCIFSPIGQRRVMVQYEDLEDKPRKKNNLNSSLD